MQARPVTVLPVLENSPLPVNVRTFSLPLNVFQSAEVNKPVVVVFAVGIAVLVTEVTCPAALTLLKNHMFLQ